MKIVIAVPVFNEERYVVSVMREIRKYARAAAMSLGADMRVLVVDDGSTDGTAGLLGEMAGRGQISVLTHPENRGYGQSLIDAFGFAGRGEFDWVISMDCDEQHEPCRIPLFVRQCLEAEVAGAGVADIVSGSRYLKHFQSRPEKTQGWQSRGLGEGAAAAVDEGVPPTDRRNINRFMTDLLNSTLPLNVLPPSSGCPDLRDDGGEDAGVASQGLTDAFCGFKAQRVAALGRMQLTIPGYAFPMQFWVQAAALGLVIREMPVKLIYKDATRHFGGMLDDPNIRLQHYLEVLTEEIRAVRGQMELAGCGAECVGE
jgi:dolichol-phosphate mannosyltransferase